MKQQIIELKKKLLLVELPEGAKDIEISVLGDIMYRHKLGLDILWQSNGSEVKNLVGKLTDITEEQFRQWVDKFHDGYYRDYKEKISFSPDADTDIFFLSAKESFFSKLQAEGIYFENRMPKPTKEKYAYSRGIWTWDEGKFHYNNELKIYKAIQEKVWNRGNTYIFEIL